MATFLDICVLEKCGGEKCFFEENGVSRRYE
jgi:hypothetical protein